MVCAMIEILPLHIVRISATVHAGPHKLLREHLCCRVINVKKTARIVFLSFLYVYKVNLQHYQYSIDTHTQKLTNHKCLNK